MYSKVLAIIMLIATTISTNAQEEASKSSGYVSIKPVNGNTYFIKGEKGNLGVHVSKDEVLLINTGSNKESKNIVKKIKNLTDAPIKYIINTNPKREYMAGNVFFSEKGSTIIAQEGIMEILMKEGRSSDKSAAKPVAAIDIAFSNDLKVSLGNDRVDLYHLSDAYSMADVVVYMSSSNVMYTGDVFTKKLYPKIDFDKGGTLRGYVKGLERIMSLTNTKTKIIPGAGDIGYQNDIKNTKTMLEALTKRISSMYRKGNTKEQVAAMTDLTKTYDDQGYGDGDITGEMVRKMIYDEVVRASSKR